MRWVWWDGKQIATHILRHKVGYNAPANDTIQAAAKGALEEVTSDEPVEPEIKRA